MAKFEIPYNDNITVDQLGQVLRARVPYEVTEASGPAIDYRVVKSSTAGAAVRLKQKPDKGKTVIMVTGIVPSFAIKLVAVLIFIIPLIVLQLMAESSVAKEVKAALEGAPEFGGQAEPEGSAASAA
jgi:hypothetical protein